MMIRIPAQSRRMGLLRYALPLAECEAYKSAAEHIDAHVQHPVHVAEARGMLAAPQA